MKKAKTNKGFLLGDNIVTFVVNNTPNYRSCSKALNPIPMTLEQILLFHMISHENTKRWSLNFFI